MASRNLVAAALEATAATSTATIAAALHCFVNLEGAALQIVSVELLDCLLGFPTRTHLHEAESPGLSRGSINDHGNGFTRPGLSEKFFQVLLRDVVTEIADVNLLSHTTPFSRHR